jgi:hypothetical protein
MAEKDTIFSSSVKYKGIFSFKDFYKFCHEWLTEETGLDIAETKYEEKISGDSKNINVEWTGEKKVTDYFKFEIKVGFEIVKLTKVEVVQSGAKVQTNKGQVKISTKGILVKDYDGKFETSAFQKFLRSIYEKWVITSRIEQMKEELVGACDDFLGQAKAYLDLEGRK